MTNPMEDSDDANGHRRADPADNGGAGGTAGDGAGGATTPHALHIAAINAIADASAPAGPGAGVACAHPHRYVEAMAYDPCNDVVMVKLHCPACGLFWRRDRPATMQNLMAAKMTTPQFQRFGALPKSAVMVGSAPPPKLPHSMQVGELIGWRAWRVSNDGAPLLRSVHMAHTWLPGEIMTADVNPTHPHGRQSGIYACKTLSEITTGSNGLEVCMLSTVAPVVIGKVALWGEIIEHSTGYRAEHAKVLELTGVCWPNHDEAGLLHELRLRYGLGDDGHKAGKKIAAAPNLVAMHPASFTLFQPPPHLQPLGWRVVLASAFFGLGAPFAAHLLGWL